MLVKQVVYEDYVNFKEPAMFIAFPKCTFKCEKECGKKFCQNSQLASMPDIQIPMYMLVERYMSNPLTSAIVLGGLEPFDSLTDLLTLVNCFRLVTPDPIVIYTGYTEDEVMQMRVKALQTSVLEILSLYENIIIKYGRFIPDNNPREDEVLGVTLASDNQYAKYVGEKLDVRSVK